MKRFTKICMVLIIGLGITGIVYAGTSDTITVNYEVTAIAELSITEDSVTLTINSATAGSQPTAATDTAHYNITTICGTDAKKITAAIDTAMPTGLTLKLNCTAPTGATSAGQVTITNSATDVVTGVDSVVGAALNMAFELDATIDAGVIASTSKTLTLTITDTI